LGNRERETVWGRGLHRHSLFSRSCRLAHRDTIVESVRRHDDREDHACERKLGTEEAPHHVFLKEWMFPQVFCHKKSLALLCRAYRSGILPKIWQMSTIGVFISRCEIANSRGEMTNISKSVKKHQKWVFFITSTVRATD